MTVQYSIARSDEFDGATIFIDGETHTIASTHPSWAEIVGHLLTGVNDDERLRLLLTPAQAVAEKMKPLSERVSFDNGNILFDGDPLANALTEHIVRLIEAQDEDGYAAFVNLLEKLATNPSKQSQEHLFHFIESHQVTLHPDGDLILYKGVRQDGTSVHAGYGIVNGEVFDRAHLPNPVGAVVEIPRSRVDDDRSVGCSTGLHAGTFGYASSFAPVLLTVKVNPRDVVSVPSDYHNAKVRVSRYTVLELNEGEYKDPTFVVENAEDDWADSDDLDVDEDDLDNPVNDPGNGEVAPAPAPVQAASAGSDFDQRVQAMKGLIPTLVKDGVALRRYRNKKITQKNRVPFDEAARQLGYTL